MVNLTSAPKDMPILIAGPTASGKSALALQFVREQGGIIINADAIQVYNNWRLLSARPSAEDEEIAPHALYGHISRDVSYSTGQWLRDISPFLTAAARRQQRPVVVGGTGLYFSALTEGLAEIPATPVSVRATADEIPLADLLTELDHEDPQTAGRIDRQNRARVQRAWEVLRATGTPLSDWQRQPCQPLLPKDDCVRILIDAPREWLLERIERRVDMMLKRGVLAEARANQAGWSDDLPAAKCIGATALLSHLQGNLTLDEARQEIIIATRQYAKRQRTWFRARMKDWRRVPAPSLAG